MRNVSGLVSVITLTCSTMLGAVGYDAQIRRFESEIHRQEQQMSSLKRNLRQKEKKALEWKQLADLARNRWEKVSTSMKWAQSQWKDAQKAYLQTSHKAEQAQWQTATHQRLAESMTLELSQVSRALFVDRKPRQPLAAARYEQVAQALTQVLPSVHQQTQAAALKEEALKNQAERWKQEKAARQAETEQLMVTRNAQWARWQDAQRKQRLLQDEVAQAEQSAQALQIMLNQLRKQRDQARANRTVTPVAKTTAPSDARLTSLRGTLPWPAEGDITQPFGRQYSQELEQLLVSNGIRVQVAPGQAVRNIRSGQVIFAKAFNQYGPMIVVQHDQGLATVYAGLGTLQVHEGDTVQALQTLGLTDEKGRYYFELRQEERPLNPLVYLKPLRRKS